MNLVDLADLASSGVRDPPFTTEFSIANASSADPGVHTALFETWNEVPSLTTDVLAAWRFVPVRMG